MSASIYWSPVGTHANRITGTSSDWNIFENVFPGKILSRADIDKLHAMHRVSGLKESLWSNLADALGDGPDGYEIEVWVEY